MKNIQGDMFDQFNEQGQPCIKDYIVLSLQQDPWNRIRERSKKFEYRVKFRDRPTFAFIYVSGQTKAIAGAILFQQPIWGTAREISLLAEEVCAQDGERVYDYLLHHNNSGCAIPVEWFCEFSPISLAQLRYGFNFTAPQLYLLLANNRQLASELIGRLVDVHDVPEKWLTFAKAEWNNA